ncbi:MAG: uracil-DNA glycosylase [Candidatus Methanomethylophilaceae archaeon]|nr:uracil-DNA glycosylase [Candidatus Methanomethylophilaceae archaeon]
MIPDPNCHLCGLCAGRTNIVLPDGDPSSGIILVGEAPGENEDLEGRPFVGRSGKILDGMMSQAGFGRRDVLITNTVKCRPPSNRDPTAEEMAACRPFLDSELEGASLVVGLGKSACRDLLGYEGPMAAIANRMTEISINGRKIRFLPTYHPAATIYNKATRAELVKTMETVARELKK